MPLEVTFSQNQTSLTGKKSFSIKDLKYLQVHFCANILVYCTNVYWCGADEKLVSLVDVAFLVLR